MANVIFKSGTRAKYDALAKKDNNTLYWLTDTQQLFRGSTLYGTGAEATEQVAGLMSPEDKERLDRLVASGIMELTPVDGSVAITEEDGKMLIGVAVSEVEGNALIVKDDGLFVPVPALEIKISETKANGLVAVGDGLGLELATAKSAGAMSAEDKAFIDSIPETYATVEYVDGKSANVEWGDM